MPYLGKSPFNSFISVTKDTFSGDASTTAFTMSLKVLNVNHIDVYINHVKQEPTTAYTVSGTTLTFTSAPPSASNNIYVLHRGSSVATLTPPTGYNANVSTIQSGDVYSSGVISGKMSSPFVLNGTDGSSTNANSSIVLEGTDSSSTNAGDNLITEEFTNDPNMVGAMGGTTSPTSQKFQFDHDVLVKGNLRAVNSGSAVQLELNANDFLLLNSSASGVDEGGNILFESATSDPSALLNHNVVFSNEVKLEKSVAGNTQFLAAGATATLDFDTYQNFIVQTSANLTLNNSAVTKARAVGQSGFLVFKQDATGSRTLTLSSDFESPAAGGITLSTTAAATDIVPYIIISPTRILLGTPQLAFG